MMDMSKAFDMESRELVMDEIRHILEPDELHIVKILISGVTLSVKN